MMKFNVKTKMNHEVTKVLKEISRFKVTKIKPFESDQAWHVLRLYKIM